MKYIGTILFSFALFLGPVAPIFAQSTQVSATIPAQVSDYPFTLQTVDGASTFTQGSHITYQITYGTDLSVALPLTIEATWSQGTLTGYPPGSVYLASYIRNSASTTDSGIAPVIDVVNNTITWTIPSLPANATDKTVTFSLELNENYTGREHMPFTVAARLTGFGVTTPYQTLTNYYAYTPGPNTHSQTTEQPPSLTPTPSAPQSTLTGVSVPTLSATNATIAVTTAEPSILSLRYGTNTRTLSKNVADTVFSNAHTLTLENLTADTLYYFQLIIRTATGTQFSELYSLRTPKKSAPLEIVPDSLIVSSNNNILYTSTSDTEIPVVDIPVTTPYAVRVSLAHMSHLKSLKMYLKNASVLAAQTPTTANTEGLTQEILLQEIEPGVFVAHFTTPATPGMYDVIARASDTAGNISEKRLLSVQSIPRLTVQDQQTHNPIEHARVALYYYDIQHDRYEFLSPESYGIQNPSFTDSYGEIAAVLPKGRYQIEVSRLGYTAQKMSFSIGDQQDEGFPVVTLIPAPFSLNMTISYYLDTGLYYIQSTQALLLQLAASQRLFDVVTLIVCLLFLALMLASFRAKSHMQLSHIPLLLRHHVFSLFKQHTAIHTTIGTVVDTITHTPVAKARVFLTDAANRIIRSTTTNTTGEFQFANLVDTTHHVFVAANGYIESEPVEIVGEKSITLTIQKSELHQHFYSTVIAVITDFLEMSFEMLLVLSCVFEVFFIATFGIGRTLPFLGISLLSLWIYTAHRFAHRK